MFVDSAFNSIGNKNYVLDLRESVKGSSSLQLGAVFKLNGY
jgi:hypothetical protein